MAPVQAQHAPSAQAAAPSAQTAARGHGQTPHASPQPLLHVQGLTVRFGAHTVVGHVGFTVREGALLTLVGESGSGKSLTMLSVMGLLDAQAQAHAQVLRFAGQDLPLSGPGKRKALFGTARNPFAGREMAMVFQDASNSLNPAHRVGEQVAEVLRVHTALRGAALQTRVLELFEQVEIADAKRRLMAYPHELSGGQNQRVMIAMAIACNPRLLIADEPTTALDVTVQAQILDLLARLQRERGMAMVLITHDLAVVAHMARERQAQPKGEGWEPARMAVLYAGQVVEQGLALELLQSPQHPYTAALLAAVPDGAPALHDAGRGTPARLAALPGTVPGHLERPAGCWFAPRCPQFAALGSERGKLCAQQAPLLEQSATHRVVRCWHPVQAQGQVKGQANGHATGQRQGPTA